MNSFNVLVRGAAVIAIAVGLIHALLGTTTAYYLGSVLPDALYRIPIFDSQDRFFGTTFVGYGALLLLFLKDQVRFGPVLTIVAAAVFAGGLARLLSIALVGTPPPLVLGLLGIELILPPLLIWMRSRLPAVS
jgi:membrane protein YqaA with SNARE-associated domain